MKVKIFAKFIYKFVYPLLIYINRQKLRNFFADNW